MWIHSLNNTRKLFKTSLEKIDPQHCDLLPHNRVRRSNRRRFREGLQQMGLQLKDVKIIHSWRMRNDYSNHSITNIMSTKSSGKKLNLSITQIQKCNLKYVTQLCSQMDNYQVVTNQKLAEKFATNLTTMRMIAKTRFLIWSSCIKWCVPCLNFQARGSWRNLKLNKSWIFKASGQIWKLN